MKTIISSDHSEIIRDVWAGLGKERQEMVMGVILGRVLERRMELEGEADPESEVAAIMELSWVAGFDWALHCIESGALEKVGKIGNN